MLYRVLLFPLQILGSPEMGEQDELFVDLGRYQPDLAHGGLGRARTIEAETWEGPDPLN
jgi:hypothetical protein